MNPAMRPRDASSPAGVADVRDGNGSKEALRRRVAQLKEAIERVRRGPFERGRRHAVRPALVAAAIVVVVLAIALSGFTREAVRPGAPSRVASSQPPTGSPTAATATATSTATPAPTDRKSVV